MMELKELDKFLKICRKQGVTEISCEGVSVKFGDMPNRKEATEPDDEIEIDSLSPEQLMFYHTTGGTA